MDKAKVPQTPRVSWVEVQAARARARVDDARLALTLALPLETKYRARRLKQAEIDAGLWQGRTMNNGNL